MQPRQHGSRAGHADSLTGSGALPRRPSRAGRLKAAATHASLRPRPRDAREVAWRGPYLWLWAPPVSPSSKRAARLLAAPERSANRKLFGLSGSSKRRYAARFESISACSRSPERSAFACLSPSPLSDSFFSSSLSSSVLFPSRPLAARSLAGRSARAPSTHSPSRERSARSGASEKLGDGRQRQTSPGFVGERAKSWGTGVSAKQARDLFPGFVGGSRRLLRGFLAGVLGFQRCLLRGTSYADEKNNELTSSWRRSLARYSSGKADVIVGLLFKEFCLVCLGAVTAKK